MPYLWTTKNGHRHKHYIDDKYDEEICLDESCYKIDMELISDFEKEVDDGRKCRSFIHT